VIPSLESSTKGENRYVPGPAALMIRAWVVVVVWELPATGGSTEFGRISLLNTRCRGLRMTKIRSRPSWA